MGLARGRKDFVYENLPKNRSFLELCEVVATNLEFWPDYTYRRAWMVAVSQRGVGELKDKYVAEVSGADQVSREKIESRYLLKLGFRILDTFGRAGFKFLFESSPSGTSTDRQDTLGPRASGRGES